jgi:hypothetical protein
MFKKWISVFLSLSLAASAIFFAWSPALGKEATACSNPARLSFGHEGFSSAATDFDCMVRTRQVKQLLAPPAKGFTYARGPILIRTATDVPGKFPGPAQVFFDLKPAEAASYSNGKLGIYRYNLPKAAWEKVPSTKVSSPDTGFTRIAGAVDRFGLYALGKTR